MTEPLASTGVDTPAEMPPGGPLAPADAERLRRLFEDHFDFAWRFLTRQGLDPAEIDDVVQDGLLIMVRKAPVHLTPSEERAYLCGVIRRIAMAVRRKRRVYEDPEAAELRDPAPGLDELVDRQRACSTLDQILARLSEELRSVFVLHEIEQMTMIDIASALAIPAGTVASRLRRARELFAAEIAGWWELSPAEIPGRRQT